MKDITLLNTIIKVKNSMSTPFTFKSADFVQEFRVKVLEKWLVSLRNVLEKWLVSLRNSFGKWLERLTNHFSRPLRRLTNHFSRTFTLIFST